VAQIFAGLLAAAAARCWHAGNQIVCSDLEAVEVDTLAGRMTAVTLVEAAAADLYSNGLRMVVDVVATHCCLAYFHRRMVLVVVATYLAARLRAICVRRRQRLLTGRGKGRSSRQDWNILAGHGTHAWILPGVLMCY
jgi:1,4-dihydroxy-2-naphthoate octaprenyltransferase